MSGRLDALFEFVRRGLIEPLVALGGLVLEALRSLATGLWRFRWRVVIAIILVLIVHGLCDPSALRIGTPRRGAGAY